MRGLFIMNKPKGPSSAGFLRTMKRTCGINEKIGHGGTLDPQADGVLVVGVGRACTKQLDTILKGKDKMYRVTICLGATSDTDDAQGKIIKQSSIPSLRESDVKRELAILADQKEQLPPVFSAIKQGGVPAYKKARKNQKVIRAPRAVTLYSYELESFKKEDDNTYTLILSIVVSSGFYVRSLARDLGERLLSGGYVTSLSRTGVGEYMIEKALSLEELTSGTVELSACLHGTVQGVGMRRFIEKRALQYGLKGYVTNNEDGSVSVCVQGKHTEIQYFLPNIEKGPHSSIIEDILPVIQKPTTLYTSFSIL